MKTPIRCSLLLVVVNIAWSNIVWAQPARASVAGGLTFASFDGGKTSPRQRGIGWNGDLDISISDPFGVALDVGSHFGNLKGLSDIYGLPIGNPGYSVTHLLIGPRVSLEQRRLRVFAHGLAGFARSHIDAYDVFGTTVPGFSSTDLAFALGAGLDVHVLDRLSFRIAQVDYLPIHSDDDEQAWTHSVRVTSGLVWRLPR